MLRQEEDRDGCGALQTGQGIGKGQRKAALPRAVQEGAPGRDHGLGRPRGRRVQRRRRCP